MNGTIERTYQGLRIDSRPAHLLAPRVRVTFDHACKVFGFLVAMNERLTCLDWCERIERQYAPSARRDRTVQAIKAAMIDAPMPAPSAPVRTLYCSCCGAVTRGRQWWNRDTGYGVCLRCVAWLESRGTAAEELERNYGARGVHYGINEEVTP